jgi:putative signal transducing protein
MSGAPVEVAFVDSRSEADLIVGLLRSNGLRAGIFADDAGGTNPELQISGGVRVMVDPADEADARQLLAEVQAESDSEPDDTPV